MMYDSDTLSAAAALYAGGWRSKDRDMLIEEYGFSESEADTICEIFSEWEFSENPEF